MMGAGFARPVVSIRMWSNCPFLSFTSLPSMSTRSPRTVQHRQPLLSSMMFSSPLSSKATSSLSISISPNSFSMTTIRLPWSPLRMWLRRVVLPDLRKPRTIVGR